METVTLGNRHYLFTGTPAADSPLVVFLHGTGGTAEWADGETGWSRFAEREGFFLAVPEGTPINPEKPPKFLTNPQRWNDGSTQPGGPFHTDTDDVAFLADVIRDAVNRGADPKRVFVCGFSNGAGMAFRFAVERTDLVAAVAPVAGLNPVTVPKPTRPVPTQFVIGTADPLIPVAGGSVRLPWGGRRVERPTVGDGLGRWATAMGCDPTPVVELDADGVKSEVYPARPGGAEVRAAYIDGLGHHWPGGKGRLNPKIGGPTSNRVDGCRLVWDFFRQHRL